MHHHVLLVFQIKWHVCCGHFVLFYSSYRLKTLQIRLAQKVKERTFVLTTACHFQQGWPKQNIGAMLWVKAYNHQLDYRTLLVAAFALHIAHFVFFYSFFLLSFLVYFSFFLFSFLRFREILCLLSSCVLGRPFCTEWSASCKAIKNVEHTVRGVRSYCLQW